MTEDRSAGHFRSHARAVGLVGMASVIGAVAAFAFQILTARLLGAGDFGLLAAFFAIVNVAAVGSSALQNSVAVETAVADRVAGPAGRRAPVPLDALVIGLAGGVVVGALAGPMGAALDASAWIVVAAAVSIPLSFLFAAYLGRIQGAGNATGAVGWSTLSLILRVVLAVPALLLGAGIGGAVGAVVVATGLAALGAAWTARRTPEPRSSVFGARGLTVMVITVAVAWLTSADAFFLRLYVPAEVAGAYASVAVLVKASFILPSTLSIYLLPRFARNRENAQLTRIGVVVTVALSAAAGLAVLLLFAVLGDPLIGLLYGAGFAHARDFLIPAAAAYLPWIVLQGLLIQLTSVASRFAAIALVLGVVAQWLFFAAVLPRIDAMLIGFAALGTLLCAILLVDMWLRAKRQGKERKR